MIDRLRPVCIAIASLLALPLAAQQSRELPQVQPSPIAGTLHFLQCPNNVGVVASIGDDGTLLVDTGLASTAPALQDALSGLEAGPVRIIVNTHGDGDHVGGNVALGAAATVIAHPEVRRRMTFYFALPTADDAGAPSVTVEGETTIHFNGEVIRLLPVPGAHTAGDLVVHFVSSRVAVVGDLVLLGSFPNADPARGGGARRLFEVLEKLRSSLPADTTLVAAHGGVFTMADLDAYIGMVEGTVAATAADVEAGLTLGEIIERNPLAKWSDWERPDRGLSFSDWIGEIYADVAGLAPRSICEPMTEALVSHGIEAAVEVYRRLRRDQPNAWRFDEGELNTFGYELLARQRPEDAIAVLELNVEAYPEGFNTYDSLGEALMLAGRTDEAIANYERSLELNPDNVNAAAMLERIRE